MTLVGRYTLEVPLGENTQGSVWTARDLGSEQKVVVLRPDEEADPDMLAHFRDHAGKLVKVTHPNVVRAIEQGQDEEGRPYLVIEMLEGESLSARLASKPMRVDRVLEIGIQLAEALSALHAAGIEHGDLEPGNIFLAQQQGKEVPKVIGLAVNRAMLRGASGSEHTSLGTLHQLYAYAAPEQIRGDAISSKAADQYSLAALIYAALAGRPPHVARTAIALAQVVMERKAPALASIKRELGAFSATLDRALALEPSKRFPDMGAFARALRTTLVLGKTAASTQVPVGPRSPLGEPTGPRVGPTAPPGLSTARTRPVTGSLTRPGLGAPPVPSQVKTAAGLPAPPVASIPAPAISARPSFPKGITGPSKHSVPPPPSQRSAPLGPAPIGPPTSTQKARVKDSSITEELDLRDILADRISSPNINTTEELDVPELVKSQPPPVPVIVGKAPPQEGARPFKVDRGPGDVSAPAAAPELAEVAPKEPPDAAPSPQVTQIDSAEMPPAALPETAAPSEDAQSADHEASLTAASTSEAQPSPSEPEPGEESVADSSSAAELDPAPGDSESKATLDEAAERALANVAAAEANAEQPAGSAVPPRKKTLTVFPPVPGTRTGAPPAPPKAPRRDPTRPGIGSTKSIAAPQTTTSLQSAATPATPEMRPEEIAPPPATERSDAAKSANDELSPKTEERAQPGLLEQDLFGSGTSNTTSIPAPGALQSIPPDLSLLDEQRPSRKKIPASAWAFIAGLAVLALAAVIWLQSRPDPGVERAADSPSQPSSPVPPTVPSEPTSPTLAAPVEPTTPSPEPPPATAAGMPAREASNEPREPSPSARESALPTERPRDVRSSSPEPRERPSRARRARRARAARQAEPARTPAAPASAAQSAPVPTTRPPAASIPSLRPGPAPSAPSTPPAPTDTQRRRPTVVTNPGF